MTDIEKSWLDEIHMFYSDDCYETLNNAVLERDALNKRIDKMHNTIYSLRQSLKNGG